MNTHHQSHQSDIRSIFAEIRLLYIESKEATVSVPIDQKYQNYRTCNLLIDRADTLIDQTISSIRSMELESIDPEYIGKIDEYLDLLDQGLNIDETFKIVQWFRSVLQDLPTQAQITEVCEGSDMSDMSAETEGSGSSDSRKKIDI